MTTYERYGADAVCGNCAHWRKLEGITSGSLGILPRALQNGCPLGYCACGAVEPDAGDFAVVLLSEESHCIMHKDAFEPSDEFLDRMERSAEWSECPPKPFGIPEWEYRSQLYAMP